MLSRTGGIEDEGSRVHLRVRIGPFRRRWTAEHFDCTPGRRFRDRQIEGPFAEWVHTHSFEPDGEGCVLEDRVEYALPGGRWVNRLLRPFVRRKLKRLFEYRHRVTEQCLTPKS